MLASCAVPWIFAPVRIGGREYVDGGVWSPTNLDAAPAGRGIAVLCLVPTALAGRRSPPLRAFSPPAVAAETLALRAAAPRCARSPPTPRSAAVMGAQPDGPAAAARTVLDAAFAQGRALAGTRRAISTRRGVDRAALGDLPDASSLRHS